MCEKKRKTFDMSKQRMNPEAKAAMQAGKAFQGSGRLVQQLHHARLSLFHVSCLVALRLLLVAN